MIEIDTSIIFKKSLDLEKKVGEKFGLEMRQDVFVASQMYTKGKASQRALDDRVLLELIVLVVEPHQKLFDLIDRKMQQFFEGGMFNFYNSRYSRIFDKNRYEEYEEPFKVLTFDELEAGFVVCFVPLLFGLIVFGMEWFLVAKDLILYRIIFEALFEKLRG